mmetsp:Transcript_56007/g.155978  ORF Transcript_56007/g.155978 Transcript_56007/m.155978 type:complete len:294 (-) Transcript_56007:138-1019(-)
MEHAAGQLQGAVVDGDLALALQHLQGIQAHLELRPQPRRHAHGSLQALLRRGRGHLDKHHEHEEAQHLRRGQFSCAVCAAQHRLDGCEACRDALRIQELPEVEEPEAEEALHHLAVPRAEAPVGGQHLGAAVEDLRDDPPVAVRVGREVGPELGYPAQAVESRGHEQRLHRLRVRQAARPRQLANLAPRLGRQLHGRLLAAVERLQLVAGRPVHGQQCQLRLPERPLLRRALLPGEELQLRERLGQPLQEGGLAHPGPQHAVDQRAGVRRQVLQRLRVVPDLPRAHAQRTNAI